MEPVGWRVKDFADGWIVFATGEEALAEVAAMGGALVEPLWPAAEHRASSSSHQPLKGR